jgi:hypothetical protein
MAGPAWGGRARPSRPVAADCPFPPHPGEDDRERGGNDPPGGGRGPRARSPLEWAPLPGIAVVWLAGVIEWLVGTTPQWSLSLTGGAVLAAWAAAWRSGRRDPEVSVPPVTAAVLAGAAGLWAGLACARYGPLAGWHGSVSWGWAVTGLAAWLVLARGPAAGEVRRRQAEAAAWVSRKTQWHGEIAPLLRMNGWHLTAADRTLIGERWVAAAGPGHRASDVLSRRRKVIEDLTQYLGLSWGDVDLNLTAAPGEIEFWLRLGDPWEKPVWHPLVRPGGEFDELIPAWPDTCTTPKVIGVDPETGEPLEVTLWDEHGAKVIAIEAAKDGGKTTVMDNLCAAILACDDAELLQLNLSKALEDRWWEDLAAASALGPGEHDRSAKILEFLQGVIELRPDSGRMTKVHRPSPDEPLYVAKFDELDKTLKTAQDRERFREICSTLRSEGITVLYAVQRGDRTSVGGSEIQAHTDIVIWGKFSRARELTHVAGREARLPDMGEYGGGNAGVIGIAALPYSGDMQRGRSFYFGEHQRSIRRIVALLGKHRRPRRVLEPALAELQELWDEITGQAPLTVAPSPTAGIREKIAAGRARLAGITETDPQDGPGGNRDGEAAGSTAPGAPSAPHGALLLRLLARPQGISSREADAALGTNRGVAYRMLKKLEADGIAEIRGKDDQARGKGPNRRFYMTARGLADYQQADPAAGEPPGPAGGEQPGPGWQPRIVGDGDS